MVVIDAARLREITERDSLNENEGQRCMYFCRAIRDARSFAQTGKIMLEVLRSSDKVKGALVAWLAETLEPIG